MWDSTAAAKARSKVCQAAWTMAWAIGWSKRRPTSHEWGREPSIVGGGVEQAGVATGQDKTSPKTAVLGDVWNPHRRSALSLRPMATLRSVEDMTWRC